MSRRLNITFDVNQNFEILDDINCNLQGCIVDEVYLQPEDIHVTLAQHKLAGYTSFRLINPQKFDSLSRAALPSLNSAFQAPLLLAILAATSLTVFVETLRATKMDKEYTCVWLAALAPLLQTALVSNGSKCRPSKRSYHFLVWTFSAWLIATYYTNVLQSKTVAPKVHRGSVTLKGLLDQNVSLHADPDTLYVTEQLFTLHVSTSTGSMSRQFHEENILLNEIRRSSVSAERRQLENSKAAVLAGPDQAMVLTIVFHRAVQRHVYVSAESFFNLPYFWKVAGTPHAKTIMDWMCTGSESAIDGYWVQLYRQRVKGLAERRFPIVAKVFTDVLSPTEEDSSYGVAGEASYLCCYGLLTSTAVFIAELAVYSIHLRMQLFVRIIVQAVGRFY